MQFYMILFFAFIYSHILHNMLQCHFSTDTVFLLSMIMFMKYFQIWSNFCWQLNQWQYWMPLCISFRADITLSHYQNQNKQHKSYMSMVTSICTMPCFHLIKLNENCMYKNNVLFGKIKANHLLCQAWYSNSLFKNITQESHNNTH